jgi:hypothetical protein
MRRVILAATLLSTVLLSPLTRLPPAHASELALSHRDLVTDSDVIVVATLRDTRSEMKYGLKVEDGILHVERVLCGNVKIGDALPLRWENFPSVACPRVEHGRHLHKSRLWFLTRGEEGVYRAGTDQRARPPDDVETFIDTLAAYPYRVVTPRYDLGAKAIVSIEFRNVTALPLSVPTVRVSDGRVTHGRGFELEFDPRYSMGVETPTDLRPGALTEDDRLERTTLAPGETRRVEIPFSDLISEMPVGLYRFDVRVDGRRTTHGIRVQTEWESAVDRVRNTPAEVPYHIQTLRSGGPFADSAIMMLRLKRIETARFADELMSLCDSLDTPLRTQVMNLITWLDIPSEDQMDFYLARADDPRAEVRASASNGIGILLQSSSYRREEAVAFLLTMLDDEDPMTRRGAIGTVNNARVVEALPSLKIIARNDPDEETRRSAWWAIDVLEGRQPCKDRRIEKQGDDDR